MTALQDSGASNKTVIQAGLLYFVLAVAGILLTRSNDSIAILWFANALAVAYMFGQTASLRMQILGACTIASVTANLVSGNDLGASALYSFANVLEIVLVVYTTETAGLARQFEQSSNQLLKLITLGFFLPCACSATLAAALASWYGLGEFNMIFTKWYVDTALGQTLIFPLMRLWLRPEPRFLTDCINWRRFLSAATTTLAVVVLAVTYLPFPLLYVLVTLTFATQKLVYEESQLLLVLAVTCLGLLATPADIMPLNVAGSWQTLFIYLPIIITIIPPMLLAASLNENRVKEAERLRVAQDLARSQTNLQATIDHMPALICFVDTDMVLRFANDAYFKWFHVDGKVSLNKPVREVIGEEVFLIHLPYIEAALQGQPQLFERVMQDQQGETHYLLATYIPQYIDGTVHGMYSFVTDISPLKRSQAQEMRTQAKLKSIFEAAGEFAIISTDLQGVIRYFSPGAERMLGYSALEMENRQTPLIIHLPEEIEARSALLSAELGTNIQDFEVLAVKARMGKPQAQQWTYVTKQGQQVPVTLVISAVHNEDHEIDGYLGIAIDISRQKQLEASLIAARDQAETASRTKSGFLANMSHEIRTPMNAVLGMSYLLSKTDLTPTQRNYLEMIRSSGQSLLGILNDILDISKIEAGRIELSPTRFMLKDILSALANMMSVNVGEKQLELSMGVDAGVPKELIGDALRLQQVLINIIGNAIKFTERGEVSLLVQQASSNEAGLMIQFIIRDTGIGMTTEQQGRLFNAFQQADASTSRRFGGTGLGLAISKRFVDLMGGNIEVNSTAGAGTEFIVSIPMQPVPETADSLPALPGTAQNDTDLESAVNHLTDRSHKKILVVDDNHTSRNYIAKTVQAWGWQADTAESGPDAITKIRRQVSEQGKDTLDYRAILVDWHMPVQDGIATIQELKNLLQDSDIPLILMSSAYDRSALGVEGHPAGPDAVLLKPVTGSSLYDVLQETARQTHADTSPTVGDNAASQRFAGKRFLLVEDNYFNQVVATKVLEQTGARVDIANNGAEAVQLLKTSTEQFDLVLMDIQMPVMDGWTATEILRKELALTLPILAMTAGVMTAEREHCLSAGMDDVISKPIDIDQMLSVLECYLPKNGKGDQGDTGSKGNRPATTSNGDTTTTPTTSETGQTKDDSVSNASDIFDPVKIIGLAKGNPTVMKTLFGVIQNMVNHARNDFDKARQHWQNGDDQQAARTLHTMRGSIGTLGAKDFAKAALALETAILEKNHDLIPALFAMAENKLTLTITSVKTWLQDQEKVVG